jgi:beta-glucosidase
LTCVRIETRQQPRICGNCDFDFGMSPAESAQMARRADLVIAFGIRVEGEDFDLPDPTLPCGRDAVIDAL